MMTITARQKRILTEVIKSYINIASPVSSGLIYKKKKIKASPATIRNEMEVLTDEGYLYQPYTSAGRIPTDKGYRFFVDNLLKNLSNRENQSQNIYSKYFDLTNLDFQNILKVSQLVTKKIAQISSNLSLFYSEKERFTYKEGWKEIMQKPEFKETNLIFEFTKSLESIENDINNFIPDRDEEVDIYIGKEIHIPRCHNISLIVSKYCIPKIQEKGLIAILGPKRMSYNKNISLVNSVSKLLERIK